MRRLFSVLACLLLIGSVAVAGTMAYTNQQAPAGQGIEQTIYDGGGQLLPGHTLPKVITVTNNGDTPCYFRTIVAFENSGGLFDSGLVQPTWNDTDYTISPAGSAQLDGVSYALFVATYNTVLESSKTAPASLEAISMSADAQQSHLAAAGDDYTVLAVSQAIWQSVNDEVWNIDMLQALHGSNYADILKNAQ